MAPRKTTKAAAAGPAVVSAPSSTDNPPSGDDTPAELDQAAELVPAPHTWSVGKSRRMISAGRCPGGVGVLDEQTGACAACPSGAECATARFHPEA